MTRATLARTMLALGAGFLLGRLLPPPDPSAAQYRVDPDTGASMALLIDTNGDPRDGFDTWLGNPTEFRWDSPASIVYQVLELDSAGLWVLTGMGTGEANIQPQTPRPQCEKCPEAEQH